MAKMNTTEALFAHTWQRLRRNQRSFNVSYNFGKGKFECNVFHNDLVADRTFENKSVKAVLWDCIDWSYTLDQTAKTLTNQ